MKKTEKIELRVDHAEKERLSSIAERRGQTVSDVVREALAGELGALPPAFPKWPGAVAIGALALSAVALIVSARTAPGAVASVIYPETAQVRAQSWTRSEMGGIMGHQEIGFDIPLHRAEERRFDLDSGNGHVVRTVLRTRPGDDGLLLHIEAESCLVAGDECLIEPMPSIAVEMRPVHGSRAETSARLENLTELEIEIGTSTRRIDPPNETET
ncbi:ribbon-helix-helix protein, CopG family [uncultured Algimonas sp.]|uniref:ribbon-helix-helix protein, CopG family n=1 Tax=uncultured Algimonas sp. TaxID=1547920 RepID=UPI0026053E55|nr:ribbon-helix-helix protein, CopG family [uncultured Algimonas sp.]